MRNATVELARTVSVLAPQDCLELLSHYASASLACTDRARPSVLPVTVSVQDGTVLVALPHGTPAPRFAGQVVALGASVPATPGQEGWWVVVRGTLRQPLGKGVMALDPLEMEGQVLAMAPRRRWLRW